MGQAPLHAGRARPGSAEIQTKGARVCEDRVLRARKPEPRDGSDRLTAGAAAVYATLSAENYSRLILLNDTGIGRGRVGPALAIGLTAGLSRPGAAIARPIAVDQRPRRYASSRVDRP